MASLSMRVQSIGAQSRLLGSQKPAAHFRVRAEADVSSKAVAAEPAKPATPSVSASASSTPPPKPVAPATPTPAPAAAADASSSAKKPSPLERGGTLKGKEAAGKDPAPSTLGATTKVAITGDKFQDPRWVNGTWDLAQFTKDGKVDWDGVIDAEVVRRQWLEENPQSSSNDDKVLFDTSTIPWWAWVRRFHLPEAEKLNGRAAMVGFFMAYAVDAASGVGLVDQMSGFFGKFLLLVTVVGVLLIRRNEDASVLKGLLDESTFYDKQWQAAWKEGPPPAGKEESK